MSINSKDYDAEAKSDALCNAIRVNVPDFPKDEYYLTDSADKSKYVMHNGYGNLEMRTFVFGETGVRMLCKFKKGHIEPPHYHDGRYEWYVISGKYMVRNPLTKKEDIVSAGDYYCNPPGVPHEEECLEDGEVLWIYDKIPDCHCLTEDMISQCK